MLIKKIVLNNYRQFKNVDLQFSTDPEKNITIILGNNGFGKTTFLRSFIWCLYRTSNLFKNPILLNSEIASEMKPGDHKTVKVELTLEHNNFNYKITTREVYKKTEDDDIVVSKKAATSIVKMGDFDGLANAITIQESSAVANEIETILPQELKDYFFYDGENNKIEEASNRKNIKNAVSRMVGLKDFENLNAYFDPKSTVGVVSKLQNQLSSDDLTLLPLQEELSTRKTELEEFNNKLIENNEEIDKLDAEIAEKKKIIDANIDAKEFQDEKDGLEDEVSKNEDEIQNLFDEMIDRFDGKVKSRSTNTFLKILYAKCYEDNNLAEMEKQSSFNSERSLSNISEEVIDQLIDRGFCLCGTPIKNNQDLVNHLLSEKEHMEPHDYGKYLADFISSEEENKDYSREKIENITDKANEYLSLVELIDEQKDRINELKLKLVGSQDVGKIQIEVNNLTNQRAYLIGQNQFIETTNIKEIEKKISDLEEKIDKITGDSEENDLIRRCLKYAEVIHNQLSKKISKGEQIIREGLENEVNALFDKIYHGNRQISINSNFQVSTKVDNNQLDGSTGIETVQNFAFVCGLLNKIKEKELMDNDYTLRDEDEIYPLVMDAPFSDTDEIHIRNVSKILPDNCNQIFMILMEKDFKYAKPALENRIGQLYEIIKNSETFDEIKEVD